MKKRIAIVGPVYPYRAGIAYCTTELAAQLSSRHEVSIHSFSRQYPQFLYPGSSDIDATLESRRPAGARFTLDILNPLTWLREAKELRRINPDVVILVWWIWVWALPYLVLLRALNPRTNVVMQCHNIADKEPAWWKRWLTNLVLRRARSLVVHARPEAEDARRRVGTGVEVRELFLPVHELGGAPPPRDEARRALDLDGRDVALFFGHIRPFKALDIALRAWSRIRSDAVLLVAGEVWWNDDVMYRQLAAGLGDRVRLELRFIPDDEIATYFAASDVVLAPYRREAQSGVILTAYHFGRPVIGSRVGGIPEILEDGLQGYLVPADDVEALASACDRFFGTADRAAMEQAARAAAQRYSWEKYAEEMDRLFE